MQEIGGGAMDPTIWLPKDPVFLLLSDIFDMPSLRTFGDEKGLLKLGI